MAPSEPFISQHSKWFPSGSMLAQLSHLLNLCLQLCTCIFLACRSHAASQIWKNILGSARSVGKEGGPPQYRHIQLHTWAWALSLRRGGGLIGLIFKFITYNGFHKSLPLQNSVSLSDWDCGWTACVLRCFIPGLDLTSFSAHDVPASYSPCPVCPHAPQQQALALALFSPHSAMYLPQRCSHLQSPELESPPLGSC